MARPNRGAEDRIISFLRSRIESGQSLPGSRLPTREELVQRFRASKITVQKALNRLHEDGFTVARGAAGTFVRDTLPHLCRYGMLFAWRPAAQRPWSDFWRVLQHVFLGMHQEGTRETSLYYAAHDSLQSRDAQEILRDVQAHRLSGLIFASPPFGMEETPILRERQIGRVGIMASPTYDINAVYPDMTSFRDRALRHLRERGRTRLAVLRMTPISAPAGDDEWLAAAREHGLTLPPHCIQYCPPEAPWTAHPTARLLMRLPAEERPDALVIADDNLVDHAIAGLVASGQAQEGRVDIIAHCNFPATTSPALPCRRLGFDCHRLLATCFDLLEAQRQGKRAPALTLIPAQFEDELSAPATPIGTAGTP